VKRVLQNPEFLKKAADLSLDIRYFDSKAFAAQWDELDLLVKPILEEAKAEQGGSNSG